MHYLRTVFRLSILLPLMLVTVVGYFTVTRIEDQMRDDLKSRLIATVNTNKTALHYWLNQETSRLQNLAVELRNRRVANERLLLIEDQRLREKYLGLSLLERDGHISLFSALTPVVSEDANWFKRVLSGSTVIQVVHISSPVNQKTQALLIALPIFDRDDDVSGAVLALRDLSREFTAALAVSRVGDTGESYAFGRDGYMYSESRFAEQLRQMGLITGDTSVMQIQLRDPGVDLTRGEKTSANYQQWPLNEMARAALVGMDGFNVEGYRDYRGVPVAGAWTWVAEAQMGLVAEIDIEEAFSTISLVKRSLYILFIALSLFTTAAWILFHRQRNQNERLQTVNEQLQIEMQQRKQIEEQLRNVIERSPQAMLMADGDGKIVLVNQQCESLFAYSREELMGREVETLMPLSVRPQHRVYRDRYLHEQRTRMMGAGRELLASRKDGSTVAVEIGLSPIFTQGHWYVLATIADISERREFIQRLQQARDYAEAATQAKSQFLANMSHEIRTPLNAVLGYTQLLQRETNLTPAQQKQITAMHSAGNHLLGLINSILDLSKIESGLMEIHPAPFDLNATLNTINDLFRLKCEQKNIRWRLQSNLPERCVLVGDQQKINQILINLVGNAVKFTAEGEVALSVEKQHNQVKMVISDQGPGIDESDIARVFEAFTQTSVGRQHGGTGLGLSISHKLVQMMGGLLQLKNVAPHGCEVLLQLPLADANVVSSGNAEPSKQDWRLSDGVQATALIVDDNEDNREVLRGILQRMRFTVVCGDDGDQAQRLIDQHSPQIVFMDIRMKRLNGMDALRQIRSQERNAGLVVVAVSASSMTLHRDQFLEAGFDDFIAKPFTYLEVVSSAHRLLSLAMEQISSDETLARQETVREIKLTAPSSWLNEMREAAQLGQLTRAQRLLQQLDASQISSSTVLYFQQLITEFRWEELVNALNHNAGE